MIVLVLVHVEDKRTNISEKYFLKQFYRKMAETSSGNQIKNEVAGNDNKIIAGNNVGGDFTIYFGNEEVRGEAREKLLEEKVAEYKNWITEGENDSKLRSKLDQLKIEDRKCFVERRVKKEKKEEEGEKGMSTASSACP